ncbi:arylsulfatase [Armatimonas sp.]|uniref:sulfatase family protein n=1 Tax=Armatimonas sp. TaxID=1872638 RepID=UPI0037531D78
MQPNIVLIYTDDLGFGDVGCYGAKLVKTPNIDRIAREGLRFTDAHAPSATCTPSRYALLTGEYAWRKPGTGVLPGNAAMIIEPGRTTVASVLQRAGYATGIVGKWHLGLGAVGGPDWNERITPGPSQVGFDYHFLMAATGDRVPCVYIENEQVVGLTRTDPIQVRYGKENYDGELDGVRDRASLRMDWSQGHNQAVVTGIGRIGYMKGGKSAHWIDEDMADVFTKKAVAFLEKNKARPFFLSFNTHDIHVPRVPHKRFVGKTPMGPRGDAIAELDWCVGEILKALDRLKLTKNTLVIFSSDNGPVLDDGYKDGAVEKLGDHKPAGPWRGGKYSLFEGGTRVPFLVRWPARVKPGTSEALVCQVDFLASLAALTGQSYDKRTAPDSENILAAFLGESKTGRTTLVEHAGTLTLREGNWKFIKQNRQLYDLTTDPGETINIAAKFPERVITMAAALEKIRGVGATRP